MKRTRLLIEELAENYLNDENYVRGIISGEWVEKVTTELNLRNLNDLELSNMWDMVYLTLDHLYNHYFINEEHKMAMKYLDVTSAFTEVVNVESRKRRG